MLFFSFDGSRIHGLGLRNGFDGTARGKRSTHGGCYKFFSGKRCSMDGARVYAYLTARRKRVLRVCSSGEVYWLCKLGFAEGMMSLSKWRPLIHA